MEFFTSPEDVSGWVRSQDSADSAASKILEIIGSTDEQDVVDTCRSIYDNTEESDASQVLFGVLAKNDLVRTVTSSGDNSMIKEAQSQRMGLYNDMDKRICPKLPRRSSIISTWNCREHCLDSLVLDDDPDRVFCKEALWRRHVMDKFSREFKDKEGKWVGGYINERFQVMHDDGGNQMELANGERTRLPRPHQYSTERRLEEGRGEKTTDITASVQNNGNIVKLASISDSNKNDDEIYEIFSDLIEMTEAGLSYENILTKVAEHYSMSITSIASIHKIAIQKLSAHSGVRYAYSTPRKMEKTSQVSGMIAVTTIPTQGGGMIQPNTQVEVVNESAGVYRLPDGQEVTLTNVMDSEKIQPQDVHNGAEDVGLLEDIAIDPMAEQAQAGNVNNVNNGDVNNVNQARVSEDFPIKEV